MSELSILFWVQLCFTLFLGLKLWEVITTSRALIEQRDEYIVKLERTLIDYYKLKGNE